MHRRFRHVVRLMLAFIAVSLLLTGCGDADSSADDHAPDAADLRGAPIDGSKDANARGKMPERGDAPTPLADAEREAIVAEAEQRARAAAEQGGGAIAALADADDPEARAAAVESALEQMHEFGGEPLDAPEHIKGYKALSFHTLGGFRFEESPPEGAPPGSRRGPLSEPETSQLPEDILELDGEQVAISGYMIPHNFRRGGTSAFSLVPVVPTCFFCVTPAPMDWIEVTTVDDEFVPYAGDDPVTVTGVFEVGAIYQGRELHSLYRLNADQVQPLD